MTKTDYRKSFKSNKTHKTIKAFDFKRINLENSDVFSNTIKNLDPTKLELDSKKLEDYLNSSLSFVDYDDDDSLSNLEKKPRISEKNPEPMQIIQISETKTEDKIIFYTQEEFEQLKTLLKTEIDLVKQINNPEMADNKDTLNQELNQNKDALKTLQGKCESNKGPAEGMIPVMTITVSKDQFIQLAKRGIPNPIDPKLDKNQLAEFQKAIQKDDIKNWIDQYKKEKLSPIVKEGLQDISPAFSAGLLTSKSAVNLSQSKLNAPKLERSKSFSSKRSNFTV
jgi:hypothetical protein